MPTTTTTREAHWEDRVTPAALLVGVGATMAALVALVVAGVTVADTFAPGATEVAADTGVWAATRLWATGLAQVGVALVFGGAIVAALHGVRRRLEERRLAFVEHLPRLVLSPTNR